MFAPSMKTLTLSALALCLAAAVVIAPVRLAAAPEDSARGRQLFAQCMACHKIDRSGVSGIGPNLYKVVGRRAGSLARFSYSPAMKAYGQAWNEALLDAYLAAPARAVPGNRMPYAGMRSPDDRKAVIAYLVSASR